MRATYIGDSGALQVREPPRVSFKNDGRDMTKQDNELGIILQELRVRRQQLSKEMVSIIENHLNTANGCERLVTLARHTEKLQEIIQEHETRLLAAGRFTTAVNCEYSAK